ncbi:hypothetical protein [Streptosporangium roseum]|uniref:hypothetical protein n=1 Tax=Streptosporangium roseum TaxID=2001 RepID=UPI00332E8057
MSAAVIEPAELAGAQAVQAGTERRMRPDVMAGGGGGRITAEADPVQRRRTHRTLPT